MLCYRKGLLTLYYVDVGDDDELDFDAAPLSAGIEGDPMGPWIYAGQGQFTGYFCVKQIVDGGELQCHARGVDGLFQALQAVAAVGQVVNQAQAQTREPLSLMPRQSETPSRPRDPILPGMYRLQSRAITIAGDDRIRGAEQLVLIAKDLLEEVRAPESYRPGPEGSGTFEIERHPLTEPIAALTLAVEAFRGLKVTSGA